MWGTPAFLLLPSAMPPALSRGLSATIVLGAAAVVLSLARDDYRVATRAALAFLVAVAAAPHAQVAFTAAPA